MSDLWIIVPLVVYAVVLFVCIILPTPKEKEDAKSQG